MFRKVAIVKEKRGEELVIDFERESACGCCANMFCSRKGADSVTIDYQPDLKEGDRIEVGVGPRAVLWASLLVFLFPALLFVGGIYLLRDKHEVVSFAVSIIFLGFYFSIVKFTVVERFKKVFACKVIRRI